MMKIFISLSRLGRSHSLRMSICSSEWRSRISSARAAASCAYRESESRMRIVSNWLLQLGMKAPEGVCRTHRCRNDSTFERSAPGHLVPPVPSRLAQVARLVVARLGPAERLAIAIEIAAGVDDPGCALPLRQLGDLAGARATDLFDRQFNGFCKGEASHDDTSARGLGAP